MEIFLIVAVVFCVMAFLGYFIMFLLSLFDDVWIRFFHKPIFIHFYLKLNKISPGEERFLREKFMFYRKLSDKHKTYFQHRLVGFTNKYKFIPREDFVITKEIENLIGATYVMLTFGMREYLIDAFDKIIIYPEVYHSSHSEEYHKGEFNPAVKAVVFSWKDFLEGFDIGDDNLNLGIHEFTHAVHYNSMQNNDASSLSFCRYYKQIIEDISDPSNRQRLIKSDYFRIYAYTNQYEFISVLLEHYFETPVKFKTEFPELFKNVRLMLNYDN